MIEEAERKAALLAEETEREVQQLIDRAREEGQVEGAGQAQHMREEIAGLEQRMLKEVEGEVVRAAMRVAREILAAEIATHEDAVVDIAATALSSSKTARDINLRVSVRDAPILRNHKARLVSVLTRAKDLEVREDRRVKQGGVLVETEAGVVDAQLETQLEELERVLSMSPTERAEAHEGGEG